MSRQTERPRQSDAVCGRTPCLVSALTSLYLLPLVPFGLNLYDEGVRLYGASQVLAGDLPYYDFFAYYGPAQFYWPAVLFKFFGPEIAVARLGAVLFICIAAATLFALCRHAGLSSSWAATSTAALLLPLRAGSQLLMCDPSLSLVLAAGASLTGTIGARRRILLAGLLLGFAATFRHDFALYGATAAGAVLLWASRARLREAHDPPPARPWRVTLTRDLCVLLAGIATVALPAYGLLALHGPQRLANALLTEPARLMPYRTLPYGYNELPFLHAGNPNAVSRTLGDPGTVALFVTPLLALILSFRLFSRSERSRLAHPPARTETLLFALVTAAGLAVYALGRSDSYHVYPLHVLSVLVLSLLLGRHVTSAWPVAAIVSTLLVVTGLRVGLVASGKLTAVPLSTPRAHWIAVSATHTWVADAVRDISTVGSNGPILVAAPRHDRVHTNALLLYFLSGRASGTYFHDMIPGLTTTRAVQEHIVRDLARNHVHTVVIWKAPLPDEPNLSRISSGVSILDDYLRSQFSKIRQTASYDILVKRE